MAEDMTIAENVNDLNENGGERKIWIIVAVVLVVLCCCCLGVTLGMYYGFEPLMKMLDVPLPWMQ
ncbi:MAG: hypothetical protein ISR58_06220 [Anaerolineales bacterium]|nr:hypothetical protein [Chloroflexota bacterium]MBL6980772.1 hypothetical protein [Anaerolineales bacterium]